MENQTQIPPSWRAAAMELSVPERPLPPSLPEKAPSVDSESFGEILEKDPSLCNIPVALDRTEKMLDAADHLKNQIADCRKQLQLAEEKRMAIAASAELIHGECDSQLAAEQRLDMFVRSIDSVMHYFDDLEKISIDFKSPLFSVLSPDFSSNLRLIENGIRFFEMNTRFKDSRSYMLKYQSLQSKITDMIRDFITRNFFNISRIIMSMNKNFDEQYRNDIYIKFKADPTRVKSLYKMCEKTQVFQDLLGIYKDTRIKLLSPILSIPISDITDIRPRATIVLSFCFKEYDLAQSYMCFDDHPMYVRCFSDLIDSIGGLFYDSCVSTIIKTNDIKQLCDACIVLKGDNLQDEIGRIPLAAEKLRSHISRLLSSVQERLLIRTELFSREIQGKPDIASARTVDVLSMLYYALPSESFGECACNLLTVCLQTIDTEAKKYKDDQIASDAYRLSNYLILRDQLTHFDSKLIGTSQVIDYEPIKEYLSRLLRFDSSAYQLNGEGGLLQSFATLTRVVSSTVDGRAQIESATSLTFKSLTGNATQILVQPLLNLKARQGKEKKQIINAVEGVKILLGDHFKSDIGSKVKEHIKSEEHLKAVLDVLKEQLLLVLNDCRDSLGEIEEESTAALKELETIIKQLNF